MEIQKSPRWRHLDPPNIFPGQNGLNSPWGLGCRGMLTFRFFLGDIFSRDEATLYEVVSIRRMVRRSDGR